WHPPEGRRGRGPFARPSSSGSLECYDLETQKEEKLAERLSDFEVGRDGKALLYRSGDRLRVLKAGEKAPESRGNGEGPSRQTRWVRLGRVKGLGGPEGEWGEMFQEARRLEGEPFWVEGPSGVDWGRVLGRYLPLVDRITTRSEFSDLLWELQGELGTSHA